MAKNRIELHKKLCDILGSKNCYFSPPANIQMSYPCIVYNKVSTDVFYADNKAYQKFDVYMITVVDRDPDSKIPDHLSELKHCREDRNYISDGLNHFVFTLYY